MIQSRIGFQRKLAKGDIACKAIPWLLLSIITIVYVLLWYLSLQHRQSPCFNGQSNYYSLMCDPRPDESRGFAGRTHYLGSKDLHEKYRRWCQRHLFHNEPQRRSCMEAVRYEHVTAITAEEMARLPGHRQTAKLYGSQEGYAVLLEVFHQIHCLDVIRKGYYGNCTESVKGFRNPGDHTDHCFTYLLQMIMCHADVGVMTTRWIESHQDFAAYFNVTRQCRNFEAIKDWAEGRRALHDTPGQISSHHG